MKQNDFTIRVILCLLILMLNVSNKTFAEDNAYQCCIKNIQQTSPTEIQFDIYLEWSGTNTAKFNYFQAGINFNYSSLANGGTISGKFLSGSADPSLPANQRTLNWNINQSSKQIRLLAQVAQEENAAVVPPSPGFRLGTFVMKNTVTFSATTPAFTWSFVTGTGTMTETKVSFFINDSPTGTNLTQPFSHCVGNSNNPCPNAFADGPYGSCGDVHLNGSINNATTGTWTSTGTGTFDPNANTLNAVYHPSAQDLANGSVLFHLTTDPGVSGCSPAVDTATATFISIDDDYDCTTDGCDQNTGAPTHTFGSNCCPYVLIDQNSTACGSIYVSAFIDFADGVTWSTSGTGTFTSGFNNIDIVYNPSPADLSSGSVDLTATATGGDPSCAPVSKNKHVTFIPVDDGNPCTTDACNTQTGQITHLANNCPEVNGYKCCVRNMVQTSPTSMKFDVWLEWTGSVPSKFQFLQGGLDFNYAGMANGGTITGNYLAGSADPSLPVVQQSPNWNLNATSKQIRLLAATASPESIATSIPSAPGFRLGTFVLNNTVPFTPLSSPNFAWSFTLSTSSTTQTKVAAYLNGATSGIEITVPAQHCVENNILLNACLNANIDDGDPCTDDACNSETGAITHTFTCGGVTLTSKIFIEAYYLGGGTMAAPLFTAAMSGDPTDADFITISAMTPGGLHTLVDARTAILKTNGFVQVTFGAAVIPGNPYYLKITHRNAVTTWSANPVILSSNTTYTFSDAASKAFGDNQIGTHNIPGQSGDGFGFALYSGDVWDGNFPDSGTQDGSMDATDFLELDPHVQNGDGGYVVTDLDGNGSVDATDFLWLDPNIQNGVGAAGPP